MSDRRLPDPSTSDAVAPLSRDRVNAGYIPLPKLDRLMELRDALVVLKGPLANNPSLRGNVQNLLINEETDDRVLGKISNPMPPPTRLIPFG
ncbi:type VI secretion system contractile sheath small subunit [Pseudomonas sp. D8002]|uniref:type VI secretion system contractile sheath small subunit n=1 Tax=Pseudomonas sp. D8002 TaxID=2738816 RepID=UPI0035280715